MSSSRPRTSSRLGQRDGAPSPSGAVRAPSATRASLPWQQQQQPQTPGHKERVEFLIGEANVLVEGLTDLAALQQGKQAAFADAATDLQRGSDTLRAVAETLVQEGHATDESGMATLQDALQEIDTALCTLGALQLDDHHSVVSRTSRALRTLCKHLARDPTPQSLASGSCFKAAVEAQQAWRGVIAAAREGSGAVKDCLEGLSTALGKLGTVRQQLQLPAADDPFAPAAARRNAEAWQQGGAAVAACMDSLQQNVVGGGEGAVVADVSARLARLQEGLRGRFEVVAARSVEKGPQQAGVQQPAGEPEQQEQQPEGEPAPTGPAGLTPMEGSEPKPESAPAEEDTAETGWAVFTDDGGDASPVQQDGAVGAQEELPSSASPVMMMALPQLPQELSEAAPGVARLIEAVSTGHAALQELRRSLSRRSSRASSRASTAAPCSGARSPAGSPAPSGAVAATPPPLPTRSPLGRGSVAAAAGDAALAPFAAFAGTPSQQLDAQDASQQQHQQPKPALQALLDDLVVQCSSLQAEMLALRQEALEDDGLSPDAAGGDAMTALSWGAPSGGDGRLSALSGSPPPGGPLALGARPIRSTLSDLGDGTGAVSGDGGSGLANAAAAEAASHGAPYRFTRYDNPLAAAEEAAASPAGSLAGSPEPSGPPPKVPTRQQADEPAAVQRAPQAESEPASPTRLPTDAALNQQQLARVGSGLDGSAVAPEAAAAANATSGAPVDLLLVDAAAADAGSDGAARVAELFDALAFVHARCDGAAGDLAAVRSLSGPDLRAWLAAGRNCDRAAEVIGGAVRRITEAIHEEIQRRKLLASPRIDVGGGDGHSEGVGSAPGSPTPGAPVTGGSWRIAAVYTPGRDQQAVPQEPEQRPAVFAAPRAATPVSEMRASARSGPRPWPLEGPAASPSASGDTGSCASCAAPISAAPAATSSPAKPPPLAQLAAADAAPKPAAGEDSAESAGPEPPSPLPQPLKKRARQAAQPGDSAGPEAAPAVAGGSVISVGVAAGAEDAVGSQQEATELQQEHVGRVATLQSELASARGQLENAQLQLRRLKNRLSAVVAGRRRSSAAGARPGAHAPTTVIGEGLTLAIGAPLAPQQQQQQQAAEGSAAVEDLGADLVSEGEGDEEDPLEVQQAVIEVLQEQVHSAQQLALERDGQVAKLERTLSALGSVVSAAGAAVEAERAASDSGLLRALSIGGGVGAAATEVAPAGPEAVAAAAAAGMAALAAAVAGETLGVDEVDAEVERVTAAMRQRLEELAAAAAAAQYEPLPLQQQQAMAKDAGAPSFASPEVGGMMSPVAGSSIAQGSSTTGSPPPHAGFRPLLGHGREAGGTPDSSSDWRTPLLSRTCAYSDAPDSTGAFGSATGGQHQRGSPSPEPSGSGDGSPFAVRSGSGARASSPTRAALEARLAQRGSAAQSRLRALLAAGGLTAPRPGGVSLVGTISEDGSVTLEATGETGETEDASDSEVTGGWGSPRAGAAEEDASPAAAPSGAAGSSLAAGSAATTTSPSGGGASGRVAHRALQYSELIDDESDSAGGLDATPEAALERARHEAAAANRRASAARADYEALRRELDASEANAAELLASLQEKAARVAELERELAARDAQIVALHAEVAVRSAGDGGSLGAAGDEDGSGLQARLAEQLARMDKERATWLAERSALKDIVQALVHHGPGSDQGTDAGATQSPGGQVAGRAGSPAPKAVAETLQQGRPSSSQIVAAAVEANGASPVGGAALFMEPIGVVAAATAGIAAARGAAAAAGMPPRAMSRGASASAADAELSLAVLRQQLDEGRTALEEIAKLAASEAAPAFEAAASGAGGEQDDGIPLPLAAWAEDVRRAHEGMQAELGVLTAALAGLQREAVAVAEAAGPAPAGRRGSPGREGRSVSPGGRGGAGSYAARGGRGDAAAQAAAAAEVQILALERELDAKAQVIGTLSSRMAALLSEAAAAEGLRARAADLAADNAALREEATRMADTVARVSVAAQDKAAQLRALQSEVASLRSSRHALTTALAGNKQLLRQITTLMDAGAALQHELDVRGAEVEQLRRASVAGTTSSDAGGALGSPPVAAAPPADLSFSGVPEATADSPGALDAPAGVPAAGDDELGAGTSTPIWDVEAAYADDADAADAAPDGAPTELAGALDGIAVEGACVGGGSGDDTLGLIRDLSMRAREVEQLTAALGQARQELADAHEELDYLRQQVAEREDALVELAAELDMARGEARHFQAAAVSASAAPSTAPAKEGATQPLRVQVGGDGETAGPTAQEYGSRGTWESPPHSPAMAQEVAIAAARAAADAGGEREAALARRLEAAQAELDARDAALTALRHEVELLHRADEAGPGTLAAAASAASDTEASVARAALEAEVARLNRELLAARAGAAAAGGGEREGRQSSPLPFDASLAALEGVGSPSSGAGGSPAAALAAELQQTRGALAARAAEVAHLHEVVGQLQRALMAWQCGDGTGDAQPTATAAAGAISAAAQAQGAAAGAEGAAAAAGAGIKQGAPDCRDDLIALLSSEAEHLRAEARAAQEAAAEAQRALEESRQQQKQLTPLAAAALREARAEATAEAERHEQELSAMRALLLELQAESNAKDSAISRLEQRLELRVGAGYARTEEMRRLYKELSTRDIHIQRLEARLRLMSDQIESLVRLEAQQAEAVTALDAAAMGGSGDGRFRSTFPGGGRPLSAGASLSGGGGGLLRPSAPGGGSPQQARRRSGAAANGSPQQHAAGRVSMPTVPGLGGAALARPRCSLPNGAAPGAGALSPAPKPPRGSSSTTSPLRQLLQQEQQEGILRPKSWQQQLRQSGGGSGSPERDQRVQQHHPAVRWQELIATGWRQEGGVLAPSAGGPDGGAAGSDAE